MIGRYSKLSKFCALLLLLVGGCASKTQATRYYLLSDPGLSTGSNLAQVASDVQCVARAGVVSIAPYLQRTHIVLQSGTNELVPALQHRWSEPLDAGISRLLGTCLGGNADAPYRADVTVDHLHGNTNGSVVLQAHWSINGGKPAVESAADASTQVPAAGNFSATLPQPVAGYDALVSTQRELVLGLCADIRAALPGCR